MDTAMNQALAGHIKEMVRMVNGGDVMSLYERYYAPDVVMKSPDEPYLRGRQDCLDEHRSFFAALRHFDAQVLNVTYSEPVSMLEVRYRLETLEGMRISLRGVAVHEWRDGLIVHERFYKDTVDE